MTVQKKKYFHPVFTIKHLVGKSNLIVEEFEESLKWKVIEESCLESSPDKIGWTCPPEKCISLTFTSSVILMDQKGEITLDESFWYC